jgi:hypothetical protein
VVIILGPTGSLTPSFRANAEAAAAEARRWSDQVITVYTPNATWPVVQAALQGASIVVYVGHGNGFPSPYRSAPYPETQNGLGLNPVAGVDDETHQYFGERYLAQEVRLAPHAVVILHRLCYASGNPEPGGPEPTPVVAEQRADNYAAGWMAAGAGAVLIDDHLGPDFYIRSLFRSDRPVEPLWRSAPSARGHLVTLASARTAGAVEMLDPNTPTSGYFRSLVIEPGLTATQLLAGGPEVPSVVLPGMVAAAGDSVTAASSAAAFDVTFGAPALEGTPVAGSQRELTLPVSVPGKEQFPATVMIGVRWDPLEPAGPVSPAAASSSPAPSPSPSPSVAGDQPAAARAPSIETASVPVASPPAGDSPGPAPVGAPPLCAAVPPAPSTPPVDLAGVTSPAPVGPSACLGLIVETPAAPPTVDLVAAEVPGKLVATAATRRGKTGFAASVTLPDRPGLYRLVTTLHDAGGVAFGPAIQALIPALVVRVTGDLWAIYGVQPELVAPAGASVRLAVRVENAGSSAWGVQPLDNLVDTVPAGPAPQLVARWQPLGLPDPSGESRGGTASVPAYIGPGGSAVLELGLTAPATPGAYLLILDVVTADHGSLAALGVSPGLVRVVVTGSEAAPPSASPAPASGPGTSAYGGPS